MATPLCHSVGRPCTRDSCRWSPRRIGGRPDGSAASVDHRPALEHSSRHVTHSEFQSSARHPNGSMSDGEPRFRVPRSTDATLARGLASLLGLVRGIATDSPGPIAIVRVDGQRVGTAPEPRPGRPSGTASSRPRSQPQSSWARIKDARPAAAMILNIRGGGFLRRRGRRVAGIGRSDHGTVTLRRVAPPSGGDVLLRRFPPPPPWQSSDLRKRSKRRREAVRTPLPVQERGLRGRPVTRRLGGQKDEPGAAVPL